MSIIDGQEGTGGVYPSWFIKKELEEREEIAFTVLYGRYKGSSKSKNLPFDLTKDQFRELTSSNCHYCGTEPRRIIRPINLPELGGFYLYNGLDRINNDKGYIPSNVVPCCKTCNVSKNTHQVEDFLYWIAKAYNHQASQWECT